MSSRVRLPEDEHPPGPVIWRQVRQGVSQLPADVQDDCREQIARIEQQCTERVREARAAGMREGEAAGRSQAAAEVKPVIERLARSIEELGRLRPHLRRDAETDMVRLSLAIARRVLRRELSIDPEALHGLVLAALEKLQGQEICRVRVHPSLAAPVGACLRGSAAGNAIEVTPDPSREPGAVIFETGRGNLDASVDSQLQEIERGLTDRLREANMIEPLSFDPYFAELDRISPMRWAGQVTEVVGLLIESRGPLVAIGDFCEVQTAGGRHIRTQVIGFRDGRVLSMPLEETDGLQLGDPVVARSQEARVEVGPGLLGRVIDGFGKPIDDGPPLEAKDAYHLYGRPTNPLEREHITQPLVTGIRAIDGLLPCGKGQRVGIFGGSGVGKSTLLGCMSRHNSADVTVIGMIGERNREVRGFLENELGAEGRKRSVVVCATSERPAPLRVRACFVALAVAEYFRDQGANVLLVMDSVTRLAMAQREIGLAAGEPPSQKGYTPSVFNLLPKVLERAGNFRRGSITGFFTVLVEGDDFNEPICDAVRGILDGHFILSRQLADQGHYPAIDILHSVSRLTSAIATPRQKEAGTRLRQALAAYRDAEDLIQLGAYVSGSNAALDSSIRLRPELLDFLRQPQSVTTSLPETLARMDSLATRLGTGTEIVAAPPVKR